MSGPYDVTWAEWAIANGALLAIGGLVLLVTWLRDRRRGR